MLGRFFLRVLNLVQNQLNLIQSIIQKANSNQPHAVFRAVATRVLISNTLEPILLRLRKLREESLCHTYVLYWAALAVQNSPLLSKSVYIAGVVS
jgi:hypothetical protein